MIALLEKLSDRVRAAWSNAPRPWADEESWLSRANNVDAVRALLALLVIWFHGPVLLGVAPDSPISPAFAQEPMEQMHFVGFRVLCFFWLSGFLLARSWDRSPTMLPFVGRRIIRLYPAFFACAALCLLFIAVQAPGAALPGWRTMGRYLMTLRLPDIAGVFPRNTLSTTVNGSLWTLLYEGWCCVLLVGLGALGVLRRGTPLVVLFGAVWLLYVLHWFGAVPFSLLKESFHTWIVFGKAEAYPALLSCFISGVVFHRYRHRIPWHPALFVVSVGGLFLAIILGITGPAIPLWGAYCLAYLVFHPRRLFPNWLSACGGISYGIFLYGYPVQQLWIHFAGQSLTATGLFVLTVPPVLVLAYLSRYWVEKPIDRWQRRLGRVAVAEPKSHPARALTYSVSGRAPAGSVTAP